MAVDFKFIQNSTDYIIALSTYGKAPYIENYQRYSNSSVLWTLQLSCTGCVDVLGGDGNSKFVLTDSDSFASFWCPDSPTGSCTLLSAS
jgi:hypothetical protein